MPPTSQPTNAPAVPPTTPPTFPQVCVDKAFPPTHAATALPTNQHYNQLSNLPTIRSDLYGDNLNDYLIYSTLSRDTTTDYQRCSTLSGDATSESPIADYLLRSTLSHDTSSDYPICRLSALICIATLRATIQSIDYPLWIFVAILPTTICCALLFLAILQAISCGAVCYKRLSYPLCSV
jgi:hypothetical protein